MILAVESELKEVRSRIRRGHASWHLHSNEAGKLDFIHNDLPPNIFRRSNICVSLSGFASFLVN